MTSEELRELADKLVDPSDTLFKFHMDQAAAYLRSCADALDAGPVAWEHNGFVSANKCRVEHDEMKNRSCGFKAKPILALYPLAMPAQTQALRLPEPMTDEEVDALIDETGHMTTDRAVRYLVEAGERRMREANE